MEKPVLFIDPNEAQDDRNELLMFCLRQHFGDQNVIKQKMPVDLSFYANDVQRFGERKVTPSDLLASIMDGRLKTQVSFLTESGGFLLLEGHLRYDKDGYVIDNHGGRFSQRGFTIQQITGLLMSVEQTGVKVVWSDSPAMTPMVIDECYKWYSKSGTTTFLDSRPSPQWEWKGMPSGREKVLWAFQGFGVGPKTALSAWRHCKTLRAFLEADETELKKIPGIGPARALKVREMLDREFKEKP